MKPIARSLTSVTRVGRAKSSPYRRDCYALVDDCVLPGAGVCPEVPLDRRHAAIIEVLRKMPEKDYECIVRQIDSIHWFVPANTLYGKIEPVAGKANMELVPGHPVLANRVVYFSPRLEDESNDVIIAVVAHEMAHIALDHRLLSAPSREYDAQEKSVFERIRKWGFVKEAAAHRRSLSRRGLR